MPRTLARYDAGAATWREVADDDVAPTPPGLARQMASLLTARTKEQLRSAWTAFGVPDPLDRYMGTLYQALRGKVVVVTGPGANEIWKQPQGAGSLHTQSLCAFCPTAAVQGPCEHQHVAHLHLTQISRRKATHPTAARPQPPAEPASPLAGVLQAGLPAVRGATTPQRHRFAPATPHCDKRLARLLEQCGLGHFQDAFRDEGVTLEDLAAIAQEGNHQWLRTYFPNIPAGAAARLLKKAHDHHQESPEDGIKVHKERRPSDSLGSAGDAERKAAAEGSLAVSLPGSIGRQMRFGGQAPTRARAHRHPSPPRPPIGFVEVPGPRDSSVACGQGKN